MIYLIYNVLFPLLFLLYFPLYIKKLLKRGNPMENFGERFAMFKPEAKERLRKINRPIWVHAVSVGEVVAAVNFIRLWQKKEPSREFVLSTTTTTGRAVAQRQLPEDVALIYCPLDFYPLVSRSLSIVAPSMLVIFEVEIWPNLIRCPRKRGIPVALVNGRMSDSSAAGYSKHRWFFKGLLSNFSALCTQTEEDSERLRRVVGDGAPVYTCNTMKFDQIADTSGGDVTNILKDCFGEEQYTIFTGGSTWPGEEEMVVSAFRKLREDFPGLRLVLTPRHQERTPEVEVVLQNAGVSYKLLKNNTQRVEKADVLVVNTTGKLMDFYAAADIVYVGKSLAGNHGGHNIIEPAIFGKPILFGKNMENFRHVASVFRKSAAGIELSDQSEFEPVLRRLLSDQNERRQLAENARRTVEENRGAVERTLTILEEILNK